MQSESFGGRLRLATRRLATVGVVGAVAVSLLRFVDFDEPLLLGIVAIVPWALAVLALIVVATYGLREGAVGLLVLIVVVALWMPGTVIPRAGCDVSGGGDLPRVAVMSHNTLVGNADVAAIMAQVSHVKPDVLLLQEQTPEFLVIISVELAEQYPYSEAAALQATFSRWPLSDIVTAGTSTGGVLITTVERPAARLRVANVHASAPTNRDRRVNQREEFASMPTWRVEENVDLMMGDFNASGSQLIYRDLVGDGFSEAHRAAGCGLGATWTVRPARGPAVLQLDHALIGDRWDALDFEVLDFANSDHKAIAVSIGRS